MASSVLEISFDLSEVLFVCQPKTQELTTQVCSLKQLVRGKSEILSPSTARYLRLAASWMPLDYLYLVEVLHRHLLNLRTLLRTVLYSQTVWKDGSLSLVKMSKFCLPLLLSVVTLCSFLTHRSEVQGF